ncbi:Zona pellucida sperm-binding protein 3 [Anabarilius grahami]|uniref:Zona pellucida sperm-binding protein 3 n=1 Tax=Anabarilius grahami TaxID=495550 RepID=A0A3N0XCJ8_ANAGA|nr:Zona pellucida sperm-binding protein 3 [Anabarilius grahami]
MSLVPNNPVFAPQRFPDQFPVQTPAMTEFGKPSQDLMGVQSKELLQGPLVKLTWSFPSLPEEPQQPDIPFELPHPIPPNSVAAQCGENSVYVEVKEDFFGTGKPLISSAFRLGGCAATGEDPSAQVLIFESELHGCGSRSTVTEDGLVYTFNLIYTPQEASYGVPIVRSSGAVVGIECHYTRMHNVSSNALMPTWIPHASTKVAEEVFVLSLKLMTDDWVFERPSNQYFLGNFINLEASVRMYSHVPVRVFVDSCVATAVPDVTSVPRYSFIENNGCLVDAKLTGSRSHFMPRTQIDKLQFQLDAFRFQQSDSALVYITCILKVAAASAPTGPEQKACSFSPNGCWIFERPSNQYFLGNFINLEASVRMYSHVPVRVFVDGCVATAVPDVTSVPRYSFIENNGCLVDAKLTGSRSHFMPRTQIDKLQFQLDAFRFQQSDSALRGRDGSYRYFPRSDRNADYRGRHGDSHYRHGDRHSGVNRDRYGERDRYSERSGAPLAILGPMKEFEVGFGLVFVLALGFSEAQWRPRAAHNLSPSKLRSRALAQVSQQADSRMSLVPDNPVFAPQRFPAQFPVQTPAMTEFGKPSQDLMGVQSKELLQGPLVKLTWSFPSLPEEPKQPDIPFELPHPIPPNSVAAQCGENSVYVEVKEDLFGTGKPLISSAFRLGGCAATGEDPSAQVLIFESELHGCGSTSTVTEDGLVYTFNLIYTPQEASYGVPIVRSSGAVVGIECHYPRMHNVSSNALMPTWIPHASTKVAEEVFVLSLKLMTDDWIFERPSNQYFLGDFINLEASVRMYSHVPVRVFVDGCVAIAVPDVTSVPRYSFIENNGCLVDAKLTGSRSHFMPRTQIDKLQFQLDAFRFQQSDSGLVTEDGLVYMFNLIYTPQEASYGVPIVRSSGAVVGIECHYPRMHNVSSNALMPTWIPHASTKVAEEVFVISLKLMTDDWIFERPSNQYFLGDFINLEASVRIYSHVPVRVFVDGCVATAVPDVTSVPRYSFIENNGCLVDAKLTGSRSHFMPRTQIDKLQFQLDAFRFQQSDSGLVYITCILKVAAASAQTGPEQKACSFSPNGWVSADDSDQVCGCCDSTCSIRSGSDQLLTVDLVSATLDPDVADVSQPCSLLSSAWCSGLKLFAFRST